MSVIDWTKLEEMMGDTEDEHRARRAGKTNSVWGSLENKVYDKYGCPISSRGSDGGSFFPDYIDFNEMLAAEGRRREKYMSDWGNLEEGFKEQFKNMSEEFTKEADRVSGIKREE